MPRATSLLRLIVFPGLVLAQSADESVTVTANQETTLQPDEALISLSVDAGNDKALDAIVGALSPLGISSANLVSVGFAPSPTPFTAPALRWTFQLPVPFSKLQASNTALAALQTSISQNNSGLSLSFTLAGTQYSGQQTANCDYGKLMNQARSQAQQTAAGAGLNIGFLTGITAGSTCAITARFAFQTMLPLTEPKLITITSSRPSTASPDQVTFNLMVQSPTTAGLDDITSALTAAGISGAALTGLSPQTVYVSQNGSTTPEQMLDWYFTLTAKLSQANVEMTQIRTAQGKVPEQLTLFFLNSTVSSSQAVGPSSCPAAGVISDAQSLARTVAAAAGVSAGAIADIEEGATQAAIVPAVAYRSGDFTAVPGPVVLPVGAPFPLPAEFLAPAVTPQPTCSLTVQFQMM